MKTIPTKISDIKREWHVVDLKGKIIGRIATEVAGFLMGKGKPYYVRNLDCGDYVVVLNAKNGKMSGKKMETKIYDAYSGYPGGRKEKTFKELIIEDPKRILYEAVAGMLPKNKLRASMLTRLYIYPDEKNPHQDRINKMSS
ncbi:50S ribosomal protein L13 [Candidatus Gottesmanbacteria bacterium RIFCSPHIGHO2_02_FULL_39_11]|uniref:Large ribosomal subunit protein uL13 n=1 Tax=Candidatus Gottesmanbacteria bacterium RIFCSPHIGHO2_02_FULL_39_11 TaxID=1798382 RepID=A0A1F5ZWP0_9BACT|nr:MAG: 50S ribosomal protein L13 [Candidatus Gottesmanbacteria bacterium RIFCSPHIGHO2_02_FULL_39_11]